MREFKTTGTRFEVNGQQIFLRGTLECCIFPLHGYPPTDVRSWEKVLHDCERLWTESQSGFTRGALLKPHLPQQISSGSIFRSNVRRGLTRELQ